jgi:hypothetical protein
MATLPEHLTTIPRGPAWDVQKYAEQDGIERFRVIFNSDPFSSDPRQSQQPFDEPGIRAFLLERSVEDIDALILQARQQFDRLRPAP